MSQIETRKGGLRAEIVVALVYIRKDGRVENDMVREPDLKVYFVESASVAPN